MRDFQKGNLKDRTFTKIINAFSLDTLLDFKPM